MEEGTEELEEVQGQVQAASAQGPTLTAEWIQAKTAITDTASVDLLSNKAFDSVSDMPRHAIYNRVAANPNRCTIGCTIVFFKQQMSQHCHSVL